MPEIPTVSIEVVDNGASAALSVPQSRVQLKIGCAVGGTPNVPFATTNPQALQGEFIGGPLVEAGGLVCQVGNVCVAVSCPIVTKGTAGAVQTGSGNTGATVLTATLDATNGAWDTYYVKVRCLTGGTIGTPGVVIQVSLDGGKNWGSPIPLGSATALYLGQGSLSSAVAGGTGVQLNFTTATIVAGDTWQFYTIGPQWNTAGVDAAIDAYLASQFAVAGVGSVHLVGPCAGSTDISTVQSALQSGTTGYVYQRAIVELRDALQPTAWGGSGETESAWMTALGTFVAGTTAPRVDADGGYYNMPSAFANQAGGLPAYRRPLAWAHAVRRTQIPLQRRSGRVKDGPLANIAVNPSSDPADGFIYHDERVTPGLNAARIGSAMTWPKKGAGFFQCQEALLCAPGSQFTEIVIGNVLDVACAIGYAAGVEEVSDDLLLQANGTLDPTARTVFQAKIQQALDQGMVQTPLVSSVTAIVSPTANVRDTGNIPVTITVNPRGYVNAISETINLARS